VVVAGWVVTVLAGADVAAPAVGVGAEVEQPVIKANTNNITNGSRSFFIFTSLKYLLWVSLIAFQSIPELKTPIYKTGLVHFGNYFFG
jgi:hypothetical protein